MNVILVVLEEETGTVPLYVLWQVSENKYALFHP